MRILNLLRSVDILGPTFSITVKNDESLKTLVGAVFTLIFMGSFLVSAIFFVTSFFDTTNPAVKSLAEDVWKGGKTPFGDKNIMPIFYIWDIENRVELPSADVLKMYTIGLMIEYKNDYNTANGQEPTPGYIGKGKKLFKAIPCKDLKANETAYYYPGAYENYNSKGNNILIENKGLCLHLQPDQIYIEGFTGGINFRYADIVILGCMDRGDCINDVNYTKYQIRMSFPDQNVNFSNKEKPVSVNYNSYDTVRIKEFSLIKQDTLTITNNTIYDENSWVEDFSVRKTYLTTHFQQSDFVTHKKFHGNGSVDYSCSTNLLETTDQCEILYSLTFSLAKAKNSHYRKYVKVLDTLSEIGGISTLLLQIFTYFNMAYLLFARDGTMAQRLFPSLYSKDSKKIEKVNNQRKSAVEFIDSYFDIQNIMQELSQVKLLASILMNKDQISLATLLALQEYVEESEKTKKEGEREGTGNIGKDEKLEEKKKKKKDEATSLREEQAKAYQIVRKRVLESEKGSKDKLDAKGTLDPILAISKRIDEYLNDKLSALKLGDRDEMQQLQENDNSVKSIRQTILAEKSVGSKKENEIETLIPKTSNNMIHPDVSVDRDSRVNLNPKSIESSNAIQKSGNEKIDDLNL